MMYLHSSSVVQESLELPHYCLVPGTLYTRRYFYREFSPPIPAYYNNNGTGAGRPIQQIRVYIRHIFDAATMFTATQEVIPREDLSPENCNRR